MKQYKSNITDYTHLLRYPDKIRSYLRTINWMERLFKELKDYTRVRGYFQSEESADKFLYLFFSKKHEKYSSRRLRYSEVIEECLGMRGNGVMPEAFGESLCGTFEIGVR